jgi:Ni/Fe-hydrogenase 1 B-type cytochrome subunit
MTAPARVVKRAPGAEPRLTVRVWDLPVRITHWVIFFAVAVLAFTGFYMGTPYFSVGSGDGTLMGTMRFVHSVTGWVFIAGIAARVLGGFWGGNRWAHWDQFIPVTRHRWKLAIETLRY